MTTIVESTINPTGYICPCCEVIRPGLPQILGQDGKVFFYCHYCKQEWENSKDCLHMATIKDQL